MAIEVRGLCITSCRCPATCRTEFRLRSSAGQGSAAAHAQTVLGKRAFGFCGLNFGVLPLGVVRVVVRHLQLNSFTPAADAGSLGLLAVWYYMTSSHCG